MISVSRLLALTVLSLTALLVMLSGSKGFAQSEAEIQALKKWDVIRSKQYDAQKKTERSIPQDLLLAGALPTDSDDDGMSDSWEISNGLNPNNPNDAWYDLDYDKTINLFEYQLGTDPRSASTPRIITVGPSGAQYYNLQMALDAAPRRSVIRVAGGTYRVNYTTFNPKVIMIQGGWNSRFTSRSLLLYPTVLDGGNIDEVLYFSFSSGSNAVILDGLKIIKGQQYFGALNLLAKGSAFLKASVFNCLILQSRNTTGYGGVVNLINWDTSRSDHTIANSVIAYNYGSGIYGQSQESARARWRIVHTAIYGNRTTSDDGDGIEAFTLNSATLQAHIYNSIIRGNRRNDIGIKRNITFNVDYTDINRILADHGASCVMGAGNLNINPYFVDVSQYNFHLKNTSPLRDKGIKKAIPRKDFEGDNRVIGTAPDIGPDEYH
jgi:hypothetical protein